MVEQENFALLEISPESRKAIAKIQRAECKIIEVVRNYACAFRLLVPDFVDDMVLDEGDVPKKVSSFSECYEKIINCLNEVQTLLRESFSYLESTKRIACSPNLGPFHLASEEIDAALSLEKTELISAWLRDRS